MEGEKGKREELEQGEKAKCETALYSHAYRHLSYVHQIILRGIQIVLNVCLI